MKISWNLFLCPEIKFDKPHTWFRVSTFNVPSGCAVTRVKNNWSSLFICHTLRKIIEGSINFSTPCFAPLQFSWIFFKPLLSGSYHSIAIIPLIKTLFTTNFEIFLKPLEILIFFSEPLKFLKEIHTHKITPSGKYPVENNLPVYTGCRSFHILNWNK